MTDKETTSSPIPPEYELKLSGSGITVERKVSQGVASQIIALVMGGSPMPHVSVGYASGQTSPIAPASGEGGLSPGEYLNETNAKRNPDKIVALAGYLTDQGHHRFTQADVKNLFPKAGEPVPANFPRDFKNAVTTGWIAEDPGTTGEFYITGNGRKAIDERFTGKIKRPDKKKRGKANSESSK